MVEGERNSFFNMDFEQPPLIWVYLGRLVDSRSIVILCLAWGQVEILSCVTWFPERNIPGIE